MLIDFTDLHFILTVFKHKYLKIRDTHEPQYTFGMFWYAERPFKAGFQKDISTSIRIKISKWEQW